MLDIAPSALHALWPQAQVLLNSSLIARGVEVVGLDDRLSCVRQKLQQRRRISMAAVGGSITAGSSYAAGSGSSATFLYHRKVAMALDTRFPVASGHGHLNGGVPGTGPTYMEHCVHDHLPSDVDLVLLEYAVNTDRRPAAFERLLRTILMHPRQPALIVVNAHRWRAIRPHDGRTDKCWHKNWPVDMARNRTQWLAQSAGRRHDVPDTLAADEDAIAALCAHYRVPLVSMRSALVDAVRNGDIAIPMFMNDCKHPTGAGHTFLAQLILHRLLQAPASAGGDTSHDAHDAEALERGGDGAGGGGGVESGADSVTPVCAAPSPPSPQLRTPHYGAEGREMASSVCARGEQLTRYLDRAATIGFNLTDEGRGRGKLGYLAYGTGKSIGFCLPWPSATSAGDAAGGAMLRKPPSVLWVGFLRSYEHMGRARVSCSGACSCAPDVIDGHDIKDGVSVTDVRRVALRPSRRSGAEALSSGGDACCRVRLQIASGTTSGEHKFKVMSLLLGGSDAHSLQVFSLRVAASASEAPKDLSSDQAKPGRRGGGRGRRGGKRRGGGGGGGGRGKGGRGGGRGVVGRGSIGADE